MRSQRQSWKSGKILVGDFRTSGVECHYTRNMKKGSGAGEPQRLANWGPAFLG